MRQGGLFASASFAAFKALVDLVPVNNVPPRRQVLGTPIVVFQIVGVLPTVVAHDREQPVRKGIVLVGSGDDLKLAAIGAGKPHPTAAEQLGTCVVKLLLKGIEAAESFLDRVGDFAARLAATFGFHDAPEHAVIYMPPAVVANSNANIFRNA